MSHPNETMLRTAYAGFSIGDMAPLTDMLSDDITWHAAGTSPVSGDYVGKDEVFGFFAKMMELYGGSLRVEVRDVLANDDHGVVLTTEHGSSQGETVEFTTVHLWTIRDGKCTRFVSYEDDVYHHFWSPDAIRGRSLPQHEGL